jgi:hypothetical protein
MNFMANSIYVDQYKIYIHIENINQYEIIKQRLLDKNSSSNSTENEFNENFFNKKYLAKKDLFDNYQFFFINNENKISFVKINHREIFYEDFEEFIKEFNEKFNIFEKTDIINALNNGLLILNSTKMLFMIPSDRKFILNIQNENIIFSPILKIILRNQESIRSYYKKLFDSIIDSIDGFIRTRVKIIENQIVINYYDAIDQFFYIIKKIILSSDLFEQNFDEKKYMNDLFHFILKDIVCSELNSLKSGIECDENHPLQKYKKLTLIAYKLFNKIFYSGGNLTILTQSEIFQLSDAFLYENVFADAPPFILNSYKRLSKAIPFKILEKIIKKQKIHEYQL